MKSDWKRFFLDTMEKRFLEIKSKNSRFSVRRFADMAKVSPGTMSMILSRSDHWSLSSDRALIVLNNVKADPHQINILALMCTPRLKEEQKALPERDEELFLKNPYYMPICLSFSLSSPPSVETLAEYLKIPTTRIAEIIEDLIKHGYLETHNGKITRVSPKSIAWKERRQSVFNEPAENREISGLLLTGNSKQIEAVKTEIRQFQARIHTILNTSEKTDDIFQLFVSFMPLRIKY